ncbi:MAG: 23S rRNA pseudouridine(955/2504/2580) synthase RluC [Gammaproteobacteria bacterium]|nr:23S rRNA pseudouridine(955/2504/2580) synthase RluC [Gammaproteobacteria bacterium]
METQEQSQPEGAYRLVVEVDAGGQRVDNFLRARLKGVPKSLIYRILRTGEVRVNRGRVRPDHRLEAGDVVRVPPLRRGQETGKTPPDGRATRLLRERVLFEDRSLLVLDKPAGLAVHGGSGLSFGVIEALRALRPEAPFLELVHRLDRETSGCLMVAKRRPTLRALHALLRSGEVTKTYTALLVGRLEGPREVQAPLRKNVLQSGERVVRTSEEGKAAFTRLEPIAHGPEVTLVRATPLTGRTHQIRVHAAETGHPVAGDLKYGDPDRNRALRAKGLRRLFLHAHSLRFRHPDSGEPVEVTAPLPEELRGVLKALGVSQ